MQYNLTFAGVPFLPDNPTKGPMPPDLPDVVKPFLDMEADLYKEIERKIPFEFLVEYVLPASYPGNNLGGIAYQWQNGPLPTPDVHIGVWFYPRNASRWSVFRGLMTSSMYAAVKAATANLSKPATFVMEALPDSPGFANTAANYTLSTSMYMLPGRCIAETKGADGLYLVTLVDERYWWQYNPANLRPALGATWQTFINQLANALGITITTGAIPAAYTTPSGDSPFWVNQESAATLLDAAAYNIGTTLVRSLSGTYTLQTPLAAQAAVNSNRGSVLKVVRLAGGDIFASGNALPAGDLTGARNAVLPPSVVVTFPKYITGDDPVPHYFNTRYQPPRPTIWYEDSYGDTWNISVPLASGGAQFSALTGITPSLGTNTNLFSGVDFASGYSHCIHSTAKALYSGEVQIGYNSGPMNQSGLTSLAMQLAQDYWNAQVASALDEVYPGTFVWTPEGIHDIVWTFSQRLGVASTRVLREEWNQIVREMQHSTPSNPSAGIIVRGLGGKSVAQTWRDSLTNLPNTTVAATINSGAFSLSPASVTGFPADRRWFGMINSGQADQELFLAEGLSGLTSVTLVYRGLYGTLQQSHTAGAVVQQAPNVVYGVNLVRGASGIQVAPGAWTSGGIQEVVIYPTAGGGSLASGSVQSGAVSSGAINQFNLGVLSWPLVLNPVNVTGLLVTGGGSFIYGQTNNGVVLNNSPKVYFSTNAGGTVVTGFSGGTAGQLLYLVNYGNGAIQFNHLDGTEAAGNKIQFPLAANFSLYSNREFLLEYDGINSVWRPVWVTGAGNNNGPITYGCDWIKNGAGLASADNGDGSNTISIASGGIVSGMIASGVVLNQGIGNATFSEGTFAAAGSTISDATPLTADSCTVTGANSTKGVILPNVAGALITIWNNVAGPGNVLKVYPPNGSAQINTLGAGVNDTIQATALTVYRRLSATQWATVGANANV